MSAKNKPYVLGLTGGVGCGKTTAAQVLCDLGAFVVDADQISHELASAKGPIPDAIRAHFGDALFDAQGALNRRALADIIFRDEAKKRVLEGIMHPAIQREMLRRMDEAAEAGASVVVLDVPLLFETGLDALCDETWVLTLEKEQQALRIMKRDCVTRAQAIACIESQMPNKEKEARADRVINTAKSMADVKSELTHLYKELLKRH